eukprot:GHRR01008525.1.p1 GENE.GHRR01008525.1~~GHRR01008525.1.p1  ORF type:complete len:157 (+),score=25.53 GHRR01008525.1:66-536(+)
MQPRCYEQHLLTAVQACRLFKSLEACCWLEFIHLYCDLGEVVDMDDGPSVEEAGFVPDDISSIVKESLDNVLQNQQYTEQKVSQWTSACLEGCMKRLTSLNKPYKYVVTCIILQKTGAGLCTAASCFWDQITDGSRTVRWENKTMYCVTTVFGLAM